MTTLRKLARQIIELESGGAQSTDSALAEAYVILLCRQSCSKVIMPKVYERLKDDDRGSLSLLIASYEVPVQGQSPNKYIDLPEFYFSLPFNKGLAAIAPIDDPTNHFIPRHNPSVSRSLPCADLDPGQHSYWTKGAKVYFDDDMELAKVLVDLLVAAPDKIGVDDMLPLYPDQQIDVIVMVRQMLQGQPIQDKKLDNNPSIGVKTNG
jgi:hypothetical protein